MQQDLNGQGYQNFQQPVNGAGNQDPVCFCSKHNQEITHFCMTYSETLCVTCKSEHEQKHYGAGYNGNTPNSNSVNGIHKIGDAITIQINAMQSKLAGMAKFIETKRTIDLHFPNQATLQDFRLNNQFFDDAYSEAHRLFTEFQNMAKVYQTQNIQNYIIHFENAYSRLTTAQGKMQPIVQQASGGPMAQPAQQFTGQQHSSPMGGNYNTPQTQAQYGQQQQYQASGRVDQNQPYYQNPPVQQQFNDSLPQQQRSMGQPGYGDQLPAINAQAGAQPGFTGHQAAAQNYGGNSGSYGGQQQPAKQPGIGNGIGNNQRQAPNNKADTDNFLGGSRNPAASTSQPSSAVPNAAARQGNGQPAQNTTTANGAQQQNYRSLSLKILIELEETSQVQSGGGGPQQIKTLEMQIMPPMNESIRQLQKLVICEELKKYGQISNYSQIQDMHVYLIEEVPRDDPALSTQMHYTRLDQLLEQSIETLNLRGAPSLLFTHRKLQVPNYQPQDPSGGRKGNDTRMPKPNLPGAPKTDGVFGQGASGYRPPSIGPPKKPQNGLTPSPIARPGQEKKRPTDIKTPRTPGSQAVGGKKPSTPGAVSNGDKKEKRERMKKEPKKPETIDVAWRLYAAPQVIEEEPEAEAESDGEEKKDSGSQNGAEDPEQINTEADNQNVGAPNGVENKEPFSRTVSLGLKARLRDLKKQILTQLGMEDMCNLRVYYYESTAAPAGAEEKEIEAAKKDVECNKNELFLTSMASLGEMGLRFGGKVEVELVFSITVSVAGKGSSYQHRLEVSPNDKMDVLRIKVPFYRIFSSRSYDFYDPKTERIYETEEINTLLFRDSGLKDGSEIQLKEPVKKSKAHHHHEVDAADAVEEEAEQNGDEEEKANDGNAEGDENMDDVSMDTEAALELARAKMALAVAEGGECEMEEAEEEVDGEVEAEGSQQNYQAGSDTELAGKVNADDAANEKAGNDAPEEAEQDAEKE